MIYLDNAATTAMYPECLDDFRKYGVDDFFNPSAYYAPAGVNAHVVAWERPTARIYCSPRRAARATTSRCAVV